MPESTRSTAPHESLPDGPAADADPRPTGTGSCSFYRGSGGRFVRDLDAGAMATALRECLHADAMAAGGGNALWVDIDSQDPAQHALLRSVFDFHPLAIEDTLSDESRVRVEQYEDAYLFVIVRAVAFQAATPDPYDLITHNLYFFIGRNYLVTVHEGPTPAIAALRTQVERNPALLGRGPARLAHLVMDQAIDAYFPILDGIDDFFDEIEPRVFSDFDEHALQDIFQLKRLVLTLRRYLSPQREVFNVLANRPTELIAPESQRYFADVHDHVMRIYDSLDSARELLGSTLDSYLTQVSNRTGKATKGLSVVATVSVPLVVVAGMWGMNFERVPFAEYRYGFEMMIVFQLLIGVLLAVMLRWRKLI